MIQKYNGMEEDEDPKNVMKPLGQGQQAPEGQQMGYKNGGPVDPLDMSAWQTAVAGKQGMGSQAPMQQTMQNGGGGGGLDPRLAAAFYGAPDMLQMTPGMAGDGQDMGTGDPSLPSYGSGGSAGVGGATLQDLAKLLSMQMSPSGSLAPGGQMGGVGPRIMGQAKGKVGW